MVIIYNNKKSTNTTRFILGTEFGLSNKRSFCQTIIKVLSAKKLKNNRVFVSLSRKLIHHSFINIEAIIKPYAAAYQFPEAFATS